jgi:multiple sugar transport system ATP-binding protein
MAQIVLDHVAKVYPGGHKALDDLNLDVREGEFMVLVGPSGCGKSTALRSIAGLEEITSGTIRIGDRVVNDLPPKDRDIAMVFQNYALYPHMTVAENLAFGLMLRTMPKFSLAPGSLRQRVERRTMINKRVREAAQLLGLEPYLKSKPAQLSGGQRQRVAMGRAIVREPQAFLMDEPLSNLDAKLRVSMRAALNQLHERLHTTTVYVTHDQVEAMTLGQRVCVLRDGRLQQVDSPQRLFESPVNLFVAGFIGSPAMNVVTAELIRDGGPAVTFAGIRLPVPAAVLETTEGLDRFLGRKVILGIRPSDFEDGRLADSSWPRFTVPVGVTEELGTEIHAIFTLDAPPVEHSSITDATADNGDDAAVPALIGGRSLWTARVSARSAVRSGQPLELAVDSSRLHFFDPDSGLTIGHPEATRALAAGSVA